MFILQIIKEPNCHLFFAGVINSIYKFSNNKYDATTFYDREHAIRFASYLSSIIGFDFQVLSFSEV